VLICSVVVANEQIGSDLVGYRAAYISLMPLPRFALLPYIFMPPSIVIMDVLCASRLDLKAAISSLPSMAHCIAPRNLRLECFSSEEWISFKTVLQLVRMPRAWVWVLACEGSASKAFFSESSSFETPARSFRAPRALLTKTVMVKRSPATASHVLKIVTALTGSMLGNVGEELLPTSSKTSPHY
jgi:hypothetical protein